MQDTTDASARHRVEHPPPDQPWQRRSDWAAGRVRDETGESGLGLFGLWLFCILWFGGLSLVMYVMRGVEESAQRGLGVFMLAGLLPLAITIHQTRLFVRFRRSLFVMASVPGVVGGRLEGAIELPMRLDTGSRVRVALSCWRRSDGVTGRNAAPGVVWEAVSDDTAVFPGPPARVPVAFEIPFELPQSEVDPMRSGVSWVLSLEGIEKARGIRGRFVVPVYLTGASRSAENGGPKSVTLQPASSDVVDASSPGVLDLRFRFGPVARFCVIFLPIALPTALAAAIQFRWAGALLGDPSTGTLIVTGLIVAFAIVAHIMEPMGVRVGGGQVTLRRGYRGWFPATRVALSDVVAVNLKESHHHLQEVVLQTRNSADLSVSRATTAMEARWIAQELRRAIAEGGGSPAELSSQPLPIEGSPATEAWRRRARRRLLFAVRIVGVTVALFYWGPSVLPWFAAQVPIERAATAPTPPPSLPEAAQPLAVYGDTSGLITDWKWVVCEERDPPRYACRLYGAQGGLEIVGDYWARAGTWGNKQPHPGRLPNPGETLEYSFLNDRATIHLTSPVGGKLIARGVLLFPVTGMKATVVDDAGTLSAETPMSAEEREYVSR
jgi:hypothetical protein